MKSGISKVIFHEIQLFGMMEELQIAILLLPSAHFQPLIYSLKAARLPEIIEGEKIMRKAVLAFIVMAMFVLPLSADYTVILPERGSDLFTVMDGRGDTIKLDDSVWYKRWGNLLLEQMDDGIYRIHEDGKSVLVVSRRVDDDDLERVLWRSADVSLITDGADLDEEDIVDSSVKFIATTERHMDPKEALFLERNGVTVTEIMPGSYVDVRDSRPVVKESQPSSGEKVMVRCPDCGSTFYIYL